MFDGLSTIVVMPIYLGGLLFIFLFNLLCKIFAFTEHELSAENFCFFVDSHRYPLAALVITFLFVVFW